MSSLCDGWIKLLHFGALKTQLCSNRDPNLLRVRPSLDSDFDMRVESTEGLESRAPKSHLNIRPSLQAVLQTSGSPHRVGTLFASFVASVLQLSVHEVPQLLRG